MTAQRTPNRSIGRKLVRATIVLSMVSMLLVGFADPVAAQEGTPSGEDGSSSNPGFCDIRFLGSALNTVFGIVVPGMAALGLLTWAVTSFADSLPLPQDMKKNIKKQRSSAIVGVVKGIGGLAFLMVLLSGAGIQMPSCVQPLPF